MVPTGRDLVVEDNQPFTLHWGNENWQDVADLAASATAFGRYGATLTAAQLAGYNTVEFTRHYPSLQWLGGKEAHNRHRRGRSRAFANRPRGDGRPTSQYRLTGRWCARIKPSATRRRRGRHISDRRRGWAASP